MSTAEIDEVYVEQLERKLEKLESFLNKIEKLHLNINYKHGVWEVTDSIGQLATSMDFEELLKKV